MYICKMHSQKAKNLSGLYVSLRFFLPNCHASKQMVTKQIKLNMLLCVINWYLMFVWLYDRVGYMVAFNLWADSLPGGDGLTSQVSQVLTPPSAKDWCGDWRKSRRGIVETWRKDMNGGFDEQGVFQMLYDFVYVNIIFLGSNRRETARHDSSNGSTLACKSEWRVFSRIQQENWPTNSKSYLF